MTEAEIVARLRLAGVSAKAVACLLPTALAKPQWTEKVIINALDYPGFAEVLTRIWEQHYHEIIKGQKHDN